MQNDLGAGGGTDRARLRVGSAVSRIAARRSFAPQLALDWPPRPPALETAPAAIDVSCSDRPSFGDFRRILVGNQGKLGRKGGGLAPRGPLVLVSQQPWAAPETSQPALEMLVGGPKLEPGRRQQSHFHASLYTSESQSHCRKFLAATGPLIVWRGGHD